MSQLKGKHVLVLGADAIGRGIAIRFAREGARLAILDPTLPLAQEVADTIEASGGCAGRGGLRCATLPPS